MSFSIPNALNLIEVVPQTPPVYSGAPDWVSITGAVTNEVLFLVSDASNGRYTIRTTFTRPGSENIYIDWGDGSPIDTISTTTTTDTFHQYTSGGTPSTRGYNTWKIRVYGDAGTRITECRPIWNVNDYAAYPNGMLQAWYGDNTVTTMLEYFLYATVLRTPIMGFLEYVRVPEGMTDPTALFQTFKGCTVLQKVDLPTSLSFLAANGIASTFNDCRSLIEVSDFPIDMTGVTSLNSTFFNCGAISKIIFRGSLDLVTDAISTFISCGNLGTLYLPPLPLCVDYTATFSDCKNLRSVSLPKIPNTSVTFGNTFQGCSRLQNVFLDPNTTATVQLANVFDGCSSLKELIFPANLNVTSFSSTFLNCTNLTNVVFPTSVANCTNMGTTFSGCYMLSSLTMPVIGPTGTFGMGNFLTNCRNLTDLTIPDSFSGITTLSNAFNASGLITIKLPATMNSCTTFATAFQSCTALRNVTLPTSMNAVTTFSNTFNGCRNLKDITFPTTMSALVSIGAAFQNCTSLRNVTLPTTTAIGNVGGNLGLTSTFSGCIALERVVLPSTINGTIANFSAQNCFSGCRNLKSVTLPVVGMNIAFTNANSMFLNCDSLTGITNLEYFGASGTTGTIVNGLNFAATSREITSLDFRCRFSILTLNGSTGTNNQSKLSSLRLRNTGSGQYTGTLPQINISYTSLNQAALVQVFNDLPTVTGTRQIDITGATGAAALTPAERAIATGKGWTIIG
jgi:hypothetical protein